MDERHAMRGHETMRRHARRMAFAACLLSFAAIALASDHGAQSRSGPAPKVTLVYVGAADCGSCIVWQRTDGAVFRASPDFARLSYREVESPSLFDVLKDENWPRDLMVYRQAIGPRAGVPLWLLVADDHIVLQRFGLSQWREAVLPALQSLLR